MSESSASELSFILLFLTIRLGDDSVSGNIVWSE